MKTMNELHQSARKMRENPTYYEQVAMNELNRLPPKTYEAQKVIGFFIVDLFLPKKCLVIEIDGGSHKNQQLYDCTRDQFLNYCGFRVLRIPNKEAVYIRETLLKYPDFQNCEQHNRRGFALAAQRREEYENSTAAKKDYKRKAKRI